MQARDFEEITRFLTTVDRRTLFEYLDLDEDAPDAAVDQAIKKRRSWAQGQQANPKYRAEALWVIKNQRLVRKALIHHRDAYLGQVQSRDEERALEVLSLFIQGTLASGTLSESGEAAIREQGTKLGLSPEAVRARINELVADHGARRGGGTPFVDHYDTLGISPTSSADQIEQAYRSKYRWARNLANKRKARDAYRKLDGALRDLKDPERRAAYDRRYREATGRKAGFDADGPSAFLPPPPPAEPPRMPTAPSVGSVSDARLAPARRDAPIPTVPPGTAPPIKRPRAGTDDPPTSPGKQGGDAPRPPQHLSGRSLSLQARQDGTRLELTTPPTVHRTVRRRADQFKIGLRQIGEGTVTARALADRNWVTLDPARLKPVQKNQKITVTVHPAHMPRSTGSSVITIVPSHGPRLSLTVEVEQKLPRPKGPLLAVAGLLLAAAAGYSGMQWFQGRVPTGDGTSPSFHDSSSHGSRFPRSLAIVPDPSTAIVSVDGRILGEGSFNLDESDLPNGPVTVDVKLSGFKDFHQALVVRPGQAERIEPRLQLVDALEFKPTTALTGAELKSQVARTLVSSHKTMFDGCFGVDDPPALDFRGYVAGSGALVGYDQLGPPGASDELGRCIARAFRAQTFIIDEPGADYWSFELTLSNPQKK